MRSLFSFLVQWISSLQPCGSLHAACWMKDGPPLMEAKERMWFTLIPRAHQQASKVNLLLELIPWLKERKKEQVIMKMQEQEWGRHQAVFPPPIPEKKFCTVYISVLYLGPLKRSVQWLSDNGKVWSRMGRRERGPFACLLPRVTVFVYSIGGINVSSFHLIECHYF